MSRPLDARIGWPTATAVVVGNMVGTGIFTSLGFQVGGLPSGFVLLLLWIVGGVTAFCGALCYARLSAALPRSGGEYHLLGRLYHPAAGFLAGWVSVTASFAAPIALAAMALGAYVAGLAPEDGFTARAVGIAALAAVTAIHAWRLEAGGRMQIAFTALKVALVAALAISGLAWGTAHDFTFFLPRAGDAALVASAPFAVSLVFVMYAYSGWNAAVYIVDEVRDPTRIVPRALLAGTALVTLLYVALNAALLRSAPVELLDGEIEVGLIAANALFGPAGGRVAGLLIGLGLVASMSAMIWAGSRVGQVVGEDFRPLRFLARTSARGLPVAALVSQAVVAAILLATTTFEQVLVVIELVLLVFSFATVAGIFVLPRRVPGARVGPLTITAATLFLAVTAWMTVFVAMARPFEALAGAGIVGLGALLYALGGGTRGRGQSPAGHDSSPTP